jgi:hypothetical protein
LADQVRSLRSGVRQEYQHHAQTQRGYSRDAFGQSVKPINESPGFATPTACYLIQVHCIRNNAVAPGFSANCDVHSVSPNLAQADGGIRDDKPRLL